MPRLPYLIAWWGQQSHSLVNGGVDVHILPYCIIGIRNSRISVVFVMLHFKMMLCCSTLLCSHGLDLSITVQYMYSFIHSRSQAVRYFQETKTTCASMCPQKEE